MLTLKSLIQFEKTVYEIKFIQVSFFFLETNQIRYTTLAMVRAFGSQATKHEKTTKQSCVHKM